MDLEGSIESCRNPVINFLQVAQEKTSTAEDQNATYARLAHKVTVVTVEGRGLTLVCWLLKNTETSAN